MLPGHYLTILALEVSTKHEQPFPLLLYHIMYETWINLSMCSVIGVLQ